MIVLVMEDTEVHIEGEGKAGYSFPGLLVLKYKYINEL